MDKVILAATAIAFDRFLNVDVTRMEHYMQIPVDTLKVHASLDGYNLTKRERDSIRTRAAQIAVKYSPSTR